MESKISRETLRTDKDGFSEPRQWPGQTYWILLVTTIILLFSFTATFVVLMLTGKGKHNLSPEASSGRYTRDANLIKNTDKLSPNVNYNKETLSPTVASMVNYLASDSPMIQLLGETINSNNTILVEVKDDCCVAIAEKDADSKIYPASMTKVMSLLVACENIDDLNEKLTISEKNVTYAAENEGSGVGLVADEILTVKDLLYLTSYKSDTIAVMTLAEHIAGSEEGFVALMNAKVRELGLSNTNFSNCTGLYDENNYTTCREMVAIMTHALDNPFCRQLLTSYTGYPIKTNKHEEGLKIYSSWYSGRFKDNPKLETVVIRGGKTGYTDESGFCLVTYAESKSTGKKYINVIVGRPKGSGLNESISTAEVKKIYNTYAE